MMPLVEWVLATIAVLWVAQAALAVLMARKMCRRLDPKHRHRRTDFTPPGIVIVPFKGVDIDMAEAVRALYQQDYPQYELLFVVESEDDPAYSVLHREMARHDERPARLLVAGETPGDTGQKVHNQLHVLSQIDLGGDGERVLFFLDSDAVPGPLWLKRLAGPLEQRTRNAVTTGYRWLVPAPRAGVWAHVASVLNSSAATLQRARSNIVLAWGGAMAMLVETAREGDLVNHLRGSLTDDLPITQMADKLNRAVYFSPRIIVPSTVDFDWPQLLNFAQRQYVLTRTYFPGIFVLALAILSLYVLGLVTTWAWLIVGSARPIAIAALVLVLLLNVWRSVYRRRAVAALFDEQTRQRLRTALQLDRWATSPCMIVHWLIVVRSAFGRTMLWRGKRYRIHGPKRIERIDGD